MGVMVSAPGDFAAQPARSKAPTVKQIAEVFIYPLTISFLLPSSPLYAQERFTVSLNLIFSDFFPDAFLTNFPAAEAAANNSLRLLAPVLLYRNLH